MAPWLYRSLETGYFDDIVLHPRAEESAVGVPFIIIIINWAVMEGAFCQTLAFARGKLSYLERSKCNWHLKGQKINLAPQWSTNTV